MDDIPSYPAQAEAIRNTAEALKHLYDVERSMRTDDGGRLKTAVAEAAEAVAKAVKVTADKISAV